MQTTQHSAKHGTCPPCARDDAWPSSTTPAVSALPSIRQRHSAKLRFSEGIFQNTTQNIVKCLFFCREPTQPLPSAREKHSSNNSLPSFWMPGWHMVKPLPCVFLACRVPLALGKWPVSRSDRTDPDGYVVNITNQATLDLLITLYILSSLAAHS